MGSEVVVEEEESPHLFHRYQEKTNPRRTPRRHW
jgi:hypothetical protein